MKKPGIPTVNTGTRDLDLALSSIKQTLDAITGQARNVQRLEPLPEHATLADVIVRLNAITERLQ